jgi:hypothetical protein
MLDFYRDSERERLRGEYCKAWGAMRAIRAALEEHAPHGMVPEQQFLADFPEEAAVLIAALKRVLTQGSELRAAIVGRPFLSDQSNSEQLVGLK